MYTATIEKTYGEVKRNGFKCEDWSYEIVFAIKGEFLDRWCVKFEHQAKMIKTIFELGRFAIDECGSPVLDKIFRDDPALL